MMCHQRFPGWVLPAGLGMLVVILVAIALMRGPIALDPDSPEGTVQEYLTAISEERWDDAIEVVHEDWRGSCDGSDLAGAAPGDFTAELGTGGDGSRLEEDFAPVPLRGGPEATVPEDVTRVEVTIKRNETGGFATGWSEHVTFQLIEEDTFWWLIGEPWPYFSWSCGAGR